MERPVSQDTYSSLRRAFGLLDAFRPNRPEIGIRELARLTGTPRSTAHRLVNELLDMGVLERGRSGVRLGVKVFELGASAPRPSDLREVAIPYAHKLNQLTRLTVNVGVRDQNDVVYVEKISTETLAVPHSRLGGRLPLHATALGKAMLAFGGPLSVDDLARMDLRAVTPKTITDPEKLNRELDAIRQTHVAYDVEESQLGLFCVAAPVLVRRTHVVGAVSVTGATALSQAQKFASAVCATAFAIERALETSASKLGPAAPFRPGLSARGRVRAPAWSPTPGSRRISSPRSRRCRGSRLLGRARTPSPRRTVPPGWTRCRG